METQNRYQELHMKTNNSFTDLEGKIVEAIPIGRPFVTVTQSFEHDTDSFIDIFNKHYNLPRKANAFVRDNGFLCNDRVYIAVQPYKINRNSLKGGK